MPADRLQRQPKTGRRIPFEQHDAPATQPPGGAGPAGVVLTAVQRKHVSGGLGDGLVETGQKRGAGLRGIGLQIVCGGDRLTLGLPHGVGEPAERVLVRGHHLRRWQAQSARDGAEHLPTGVLGDRDRFRLDRPWVGQQRSVRPQRRTVGAPMKPNLPARQRFSGIPLALTVLHQAVGRPYLLQPGGKIRCALAFVGPVGVGGPLRVHLVVDRDERRLAANGETDVTGGQPLVDARAKRADGRPRRLGVRQRDAWILVHTGHDVGEIQSRLARLGCPGDGCRRLGMRRRRQRDVPFACEQPRCRVQADPPGAGDVHLRPGVQIGEVGGRP